MGWKEDKSWSDIFLPEIKGHLGRVLISEPPVEENQERNTDLVVLRMDEKGGMQDKEIRLSAPLW